MSCHNGFWVKGCTHIHTNLSDGDSDPVFVAEWYRDHGYQFIVFTDHNAWVNPADVSLTKSNDFLMIPGEEFSVQAEGFPVHINGLGLHQYLKEIRKDVTREQIIQEHVDLILKAGGVAQVNHPNWYGAFDHRQLRNIQGSSLMEIYNASSFCNDCGDNAHLSTEQIWDVLLSEGKEIYGVATDDGHHYVNFEDKWDNPGRAWIYVHVLEMTEAEILRNLALGNLYASTGIEFENYSASKNVLNIKIKPKENLTYYIRFVGKYGQIYEEVEGLEASYELTDSSENAYLRAKAIASDGTVAWTQPIRFQS